MISILKPLGFSCFTNTFEKDKMTLDIVLLLPDCEMKQLGIGSPCDMMT